MRTKQAITKLVEWGLVDRSPQGFKTVAQPPNKLTNPYSFDKNELIRLILIVSKNYIHSHDLAGTGQNALLFFSPHKGGNTSR